jgi:hypothetical protein
MNNAQRERIAKILLRLYLRGHTVRPSSVKPLDILIKSDINEALDTIEEALHVDSEE